MSLWIAIVLGIVQALTEFFPISSSTHLFLIKQLLGIQLSQEHTSLLDLSCHLGSLGALIFYLRKDLCTVLQEKRQRMISLIALIPLMPLYFILKPLREFLLQENSMGYLLLGTGGILLAGQFLTMTRSKKEPSKQDALLIGAAQSMALLPGISRSASTISCARILGWSAHDAVRFSFLLSIPTILGGNCVELIRLSSSSIPWLALFMAFATSLLLSMIIVKRALIWLAKGDMRLCACYCMFLGIVMIMWFS